jgi:hypothetical protein
MLGMGFGPDWNNFLFRVGRQCGKDGMDGRSKGLSRRYKIELGAWSSATPVSGVMRCQRQQWVGHRSSAENRLE